MRSSRQKLRSGGCFEAPRWPTETSAPDICADELLFASSADAISDVRPFSCLPPLARSIS